MSASLVLGVDAPGDGNAEQLPAQLTRACHDIPPDKMCCHRHCRVVDQIEPIIHPHIAGCQLAGLPALDERRNAAPTSQL